MQSSFLSTLSTSPEQTSNFKSTTISTATNFDMATTFLTTSFASTASSECSAMEIIHRHTDYLERPCARASRFVQGGDDDDDDDAESIDIPPGTQWRRHQLSEVTDEDDFGPLADVANDDTLSELFRKFEDDDATNDLAMCLPTPQWNITSSVFSSSAMAQRIAEAEDMEPQLIPGPPVEIPITPPGSCYFDSPSPSVDSRFGVECSRPMGASELGCTEGEVEKIPSSIDFPASTLQDFTWPAPASSVSAGSSASVTAYNEESTREVPSLKISIDLTPQVQRRAVNHSSAESESGHTNTIRIPSPIESNFPVLERQSSNLSGRISKMFRRHATVKRPSTTPPPVSPSSVASGTSRVTFIIAVTVEIGGGRGKSDGVASVVGTEVFQANAPPKGKLGRFFKSAFRKGSTPSRARHSM
ncbi:hypothetical protein BOTBODRAFT_189527 [Botryobasidium botryosum FD-172 SS1]|uniref:Uncharacterized protein n=1 Tax=Botryobasidium botryosum (strain FD-172 SS1) TaxID=930990 RepID=A0A067MJJ3_BOTB1|nr:hypothetical protein BOTBODRAFT_189527 [Botryobasidium botryosum FD-172 SS1]